MEYPDKGVWETFAYVNLKYRGGAPSEERQLQVISKQVESKYLRMNKLFRKNR